MGALEFEPATLGPPNSTRVIEVEKLVNLANKILDKRASLGGAFSGDDDREAIEDILRVGTSAGGARAKAILAWNPKTNEFRSGQVDIEKGFEHWLMKFDGVSNNRDKDLADPMGYGMIEYAYHLMAIQSGIEMSSCRLHHERGRSHFMTKRFDRSTKGRKIHMQSLGAMAHYDYHQPSSYSYEQAIHVMKRMGLPREDLEQQVLRAIFNVIGRNHDDHVKNIAFLMNRRGKWRLSPAFDISYSYGPMGAWTSRHQMSVNNKRAQFHRDDLLALANSAGIKKAQANEMINRVTAVVHQWPDFAETAGVDSQSIVKIQGTQRTYL
jgi:serine/threonine-protein kinase HipA